MLNTPPSRCSPAPDPAEIIHSIRSRLRRGRYLSLRDVVCDERRRAVRIDGCPPSQHLKPVAVAIALEAAGEQPTVNEIEVAAPGRRAGAIPIEG